MTVPVSAPVRPGAEEPHKVDVDSIPHIAYPWSLLKPEKSATRPRLIRAFMPALDREQGPAATRTRHGEQNRFVRAKYAAEKRRAPMGP